MKYTIKNLVKSEIEISVELSSETLEAARKDAVIELSNSIEVQGFRTGHIPEQILIREIGEGAILEKAANIAIQNSFPEILVKENIQAIGRPEIRITKLARNNPIEYTAKIAVSPKLPEIDYKKIAKDIIGAPFPATVSTDKEFNEVMIHMRRQKYRIELFEEAQSKKEDVEVALKKADEIPESELPIIDDTFVKSLGGFETVQDFETKVRENIGNEKKLSEENKRRTALLDALASANTAEIPEVLIAHEVEYAKREFQERLKKDGRTLEEYLSEIGKNEKYLEEEWRKHGEKTSRLKLVLDYIAQKENLTPESVSVEKEVAKIMKEQPKADPDSAKAYVLERLTNSAVLKFLDESAK